MCGSVSFLFLDYYVGGRFWVLFVCLFGCLFCCGLCLVVVWICCVFEFGFGLIVLGLCLFGFVLGVTDVLVFGVLCFYF